MKKALRAPSARVHSGLPRPLPLQRGRGGLWAMMLVACLLFAAVLTGAGTDVRAEEIQGLVLPFRQVTVASPVQDIIKEVLVEEGDTVREGQVLARLASEKERLEIELYARQIEQREFAARGMEALLKERMTSREAALEKATELELARLQKRIAEERLKDKTITAPLDGIVVKRHKEAGEAVERVEKMFDLVNIDRVFVQFYLDPRYFGRLQPGLLVPVRFPVLDPARKFEATVAFVDPRIDAASGLFRVKLLLDNPGHEIKAGMRGHADFEKVLAGR